MRSGQLGDSSDGRGRRISARDSGQAGSMARDPAKYHTYARLRKPSRCASGCRVNVDDRLVLSGKAQYPTSTDLTRDSRRGRRGVARAGLLELDLAAGFLAVGLELVA